MTPQRLLPPALLSLGVLLLSAAAQAQPAKPPERVALIIGNAAYEGRPLRNPANDAKALSQALRTVGFEVHEAHDLDQKAMRRAIADFGEKLKGGAIGLFYYAGHGMQIGGHNYLIPTDVSIRAEADVQIEAIDANEVLLRMDSAGNPLNIVILDACRDNPFQRQFRSASGGLAFMDAPNGTLIAYATSPGRVASDGDGANSTYTEALIQYLLTPGLRVEDVFKRVRTHVREKTGGDQVPWESSSLEGDFYFAPRAEGVAAADACPPGMRRDGGRCVPLISTTCPAGMTFRAGEGCVPEVSQEAAPAGAAGMPPELVAARRLPALTRGGVDVVSQLGFADLPVPATARLVTRLPESLSLYIDAEPAEIAAFYYLRLVELCGPELEIYPNPYGYTFRSTREGCPINMASVVQTNGNLITHLSLKPGTQIPVKGKLGVYGELLPPDVFVRLLNSNLVMYQTKAPVEEVVAFYERGYTAPDIRVNRSKDPSNAQRPTLQILSQRAQDPWQSIYVKVHSERSMTGKDGTEIIVNLKPPVAAPTPPTPAAPPKDRRRGKK